MDDRLIEIDGDAAGAPAPSLAGQARKVFVRTFGCQMNVYDSERMTEALAGQGYAATGAIEEADLVILNTCHIREKAVEKVYSDLGRIRVLKEERAAAGSDTIVAVVGCVAQAEGAEITRRSSAVDLVIGPQSYHRLPELIRRSRAEGRALVETEFPDEEKFAHLPKRAPTRSVTAFLTVQEGCDKFCTFCVVPYTRGMEYSRSVADIEREARSLVQAGVRELTLLGQNVNGFHGAGPGGRTYSLADLLRHLARIDGLERLRYTTSHPRDMSDDLIAVHADEPKVMPYLHLPFQAGSDRILSAMNRKHTAREYVDLVNRVRVAQPDIALSTDVIVGFPGETDDEFEETLAVFAEVGFVAAYSFKYSPRPGTPAEKLGDQVPEEMKSERLARLEALIKQQQTEFGGRCVGRTLPVLFERVGRHPGQLVGRSPYLQGVHAAAPVEMLGKIAPVEILAFGPNSLAGVIRPE